MAKYVLAASVLLCVCLWLTDTVNVDRLNKKVKRYIMETKSLEKDVNKICTSVTSCADSQDLKQTISELQTDLEKLQVSITTKTNTTILPTKTTTISPTNGKSPFLSCDEDDWYHYNGHCYWLSRYKEHKNWYQASIDCRERGGYLVEVNHDAESKSLQDLASTLGDIVGYWTGATFEPNQAHATYRQSGTPVPENYWRLGPDDIDVDVKMCAEMVVTINYLGLYLRRCNTVRNYACEKCVP